MGVTGYIFGLYRDNGKENGNNVWYHIRANSSYLMSAAGPRDNGRKEGRGLRDLCLVSLLFMASFTRYTGHNKGHGKYLSPNSM